MTNPLIWHPTCCWVSSIITFSCVLLQCLSIWTGYQLPRGRCSALKIIDAYLACDSRQPGHNQEEQSRQMPGMPFSCKNLGRVFTKVFVIKYFLPSSVSFLLSLFLPDIILFIRTTQCTLVFLVANHCEKEVHFSQLKKKLIIEIIYFRERKRKFNVMFNLIAR